MSQTIFLGLTAATVAAGIRGGLEKVLRWLTPALFAILLLLLIYALLAGDFARAAAFLFVPDFSLLDGQTVLLAVGQAFFSLGIGLGVLFTIGVADVSTRYAAMSVCAPPSSVGISRV